MPASRKQYLTCILCFLYTRHYAEHIICIVSFELHNDPSVIPNVQVRSLKLSNIKKIVLWVRREIWTQAVWPRTQTKLPPNVPAEKSEDGTNFLK